MPYKFENATLLLRLGLPFTLQRTYPHKKIRENGTFWICSLEWKNLKTQLFCISVDRELFVSGTFWIRSRHIVMWFIFKKISLGQKFDMADNTMFSVLLTIISFLIAYLELSIALVHMNTVHQRIRNNFRQSFMSKDTRKATRRSQPYKQRRFWTRPGRTSAWWDNFVNEVVVAEEWRENFRMSRGNYHRLKVLLTGACLKRDNAVAPPIKVWTQNILSVFMCGRKTFLPFLHLKLRFQIYPA